MPGPLTADRAGRDLQLLELVAAARQLGVPQAATWAASSLARAASWSPVCWAESIRAISSRLAASRAGAVRWFCW